MSWRSLRAFVLTHRPYGEKGHILHCLTDDLGRQSYFLPSVRSKNAALRASMLLPLTPLQLIARDSGKDQLERIKEASVLWHPQHMHGHPVKSAICLMIAELLDHLFIEKTDQTALWDFLDQELKRFDASPEEDLLFALWMCVRLMHHSGSSIPAPNDTPGYFDLRSAEWSSSEGADHLDARASSLLADIVQTDWTLMRPEDSEAYSRRALMDGLQRFWTWHHPEMRTLKSLEVVREYLGGL